MPSDRRVWAEPYKIKMVEPITMTTLEERERAIEAAGYNTFLLRSEDVYIDLLTDSGTSAMSDHQWAGLMLGDEAYAGSRSFYHLVEAVADVYGYPELIPTHQGRGAEHILSQILINAGDVIPGNMYFTTTRFHQEYAGGTFVDVIVDEAHDPESLDPFKGNVDLDKLQAVIDEFGAERIPYVSVETNVNMAGGQPLSMANLKATYELCRRHDILVMLDATRALENAYFIQQREAGYHDRSVREILRELCDLSDGATVSSKKDNLVNIGGFLALRDPELARRARGLLVAFEGSTRTAACRAATWKPSPEASARWSRPTTTCALASAKWSTSATPSRRRACRSCSPSAVTASSSTPAASSTTSRRTTFPLKPWPPPSTSTLACAAWSEASCRRVAIRRPARTTTPSWSSCGSPSPGGLHAVAHGRRRRVGGRTVRTAGDDRRPALRVRAARSAVLPGPIRADAGMTSPADQPYATSAATAEAFAEHVNRGKVRTYEALGLDLVMGAREGSRFRSAFDGRWLYNAHCNGGVFNLGHRHPDVVDAVRRALDHLDIGNHHLVSGWRAALADRLAASTDGLLPGVVFGVSGGEANDLALKVARRTPDARASCRRPAATTVTPGWRWRPAIPSTATRSGRTCLASSRCRSTTLPPWMPRSATRPPR